MKIVFDQKGDNFVEIKSSQDGDIEIILSCKSDDKVHVNSVKISKNDFIKLINDINWS
jgi:hypothetical protein